MAVPQLLTTGWVGHAWDDIIPVPLDSADLFVTSGAGTAATVTLATPDDTHVSYLISGIWFSYSAAPTGGNILINDGVNSINFDVTGAGLQVPFLFQPWLTAAGHGVTITLAGGGGAIVGKLYVFAQVFRG